MFSLDATITLVIWLVLAGLVFWLVRWVLQELALPEPFNKILRVIVVLAVFVVVLNALLTFGGYPLVT